jgi:hypothetical protein
MSCEAQSVGSRPREDPLEAHHRSWCLHRLVCLLEIGFDGSTQQCRTGPSCHRCRRSNRMEGGEKGAWCREVSGHRGESVDKDAVVRVGTSLLTEM